MSEEVVIDRPEADETLKDEVLSLEDAKAYGVSDEEIKMGIESGAIVSNSQKEENKEPGSKENSKDHDKGKEGEEQDVDEKKLERINDAINKGEDLNEQDEKLLRKEYSRNEVGLYFARKKDRYKRQQAQQEKELLRQELEEAKKKLEEYGKYIELQEVREKREELDDDEYLTPAKLRAIEAEKERQMALKSSDSGEDERRSQLQNIRLQAFEKENLIDDPNFNNVVQIFEEVAKNDQAILNGFSARASRLGSEYGAEDDLKNFIYRAAKRHEKYEKYESSQKEEKVKRAEKIAKNLEKPTSSAKVSGGSGSIKIAEDDLTPDHVVNMTSSQWKKLKPETRHRLLNS